jgi:hypothetical protein
MEGFTTWTGYINTFRTAIGLVLEPLESLRVARDWWAKELGLGGPGPTSGAAAARPTAAIPATQAARVQVDFNNLPRGTRVTPDSGNTAALDLSMGWSMGASH